MLCFYEKKIKVYNKLYFPNSYRIVYGTAAEVSLHILTKSYNKRIPTKPS